MKMKVFLDQSIFHRVYRRSYKEAILEGREEKTSLERVLRNSGDSGSGKAGILVGIGEQRRRKEESKAKE